MSYKNAFNPTDFDISITSVIVLTDKNTLKKYTSESLSMIEDEYKIPSDKAQQLVSKFIPTAKLYANHHDIQLILDIVLQADEIKIEKQFVLLCKHTPIDDMEYILSLVQKIYQNQNNQKKWDKIVSMPKCIPGYAGYSRITDHEKIGPCVLINKEYNKWLESDRVPVDFNCKYRVKITCYCTSTETIPNVNYIVFYLWNANGNRIEGDGTFFNYPLITDIGEGYHSYIVYMTKPCVTQAAFISAGVGFNYGGIGSARSYHLGKIELMWKKK